MFLPTSHYSLFCGRSLTDLIIKRLHQVIYSAESSCVSCRAFFTVEVWKLIWCNFVSIAPSDELSTGTSVCFHYSHQHLNTRCGENF